MVTNLLPTFLRSFRGILPASLSNVPLDFDTLQDYGCFIGSAAIVIISDKVDIKDVALNLMKFLKMRVVVSVLHAEMEQQWRLN